MLQQVDGNGEVLEHQLILKTPQPHPALQVVLRIQHALQLIVLQHALHHVLQHALQLMIIIIVLILILQVDREPIISFQLLSLHLIVVLKVIVVILSFILILCLSSFTMIMMQIFLVFALLVLLTLQHMDKCLILLLGLLNLILLFFKINTQSNPILVKAYVATWDRTNFQAISILYASSSFTINTNGYTDVTYTLSTPISVDPSTPYVAFFSTSGIQSGQPSFTSCWVGGPQIVGEEFAFYNNGDDFSLLTTSTWQSFFSGTLLFQAYFNASKKRISLNDETTPIYPIGGSTLPSNSTSKQYRQTFQNLRNHNENF